MTDLDEGHFRTFGFVVLRGALDAAPLGDELDRALASGSVAALDTGVTQTRYVPMMCGRTPGSLALVDELTAAAARLLGGPVVPLRAKGMRYYGSTSWHTDSADGEVSSVGFAAYLEPLEAETGALRVVPGSHRRELGESVGAFLAAGGAAASIGAVPSVALVTRPGDVIAFDEHLWHASSGGSVRRQWRVDYLRDPAGPRAEASVRRYLERVFVEHDGGYDVDRFPSFGPDWLGSGHPAVERLRELGAYALAARQEAFTRARRSTAR